MSYTNNAAYEIPSFYVGVLEANIDMSTAATYQYTGVDVGAASGSGLLGTAALVMPTSTGSAILGILQNNPQLAEAGQVMVHGVSKALCSAAFGIGALLAVDTNGQFRLAASTEYAVAKALQAGASGAYVSVLLHSFGKV